MGKAEKKELQKHAITLLRRMGVKPGSTIWTMIMPSSGTSKRVRCFVVIHDVTQSVDGRVTKHDIVDVTGLVANACGFSRSRGSRWDIAVNVFGMSASYEVVYTLGRVMFPEGGALKHSRPGRQMQGVKIGRETDGGYLLHHREL